MLHGWGGSWQSWGPIIERLKGKFTIYTLDLPGFGLSPLPRPYGLIDYVADLALFFQREGITKPILVGHSFGGQIAAKMAIENGQLLSGLGLVDAAAVRDNSGTMKANIAVAQVGKKLIKLSPLASFYDQLRRTYYSIRGIGITNSDYVKAGSKPFLAETLAKIMREDLTDGLKKINIPTLIYWGEKDHPDYTPLAHAHVVHHAIKNSKLVVVPGGSHFSHLDDQETFCKELETFI